MKNLLFVNSHNHDMQIHLYADFLSRTSYIKEFDVILHNNNLTNININVVKDGFLKFPSKNKHLILTANNDGGYALGPHKTVDDFWGVISTYDNVISTQADEYIIHESKLLDVMNSHMDMAFIVNRGASYVGLTQPSTDLYIIRPKLLSENIFKYWNISPFNKLYCENFLEQLLYKFQIPHTYVQRFINDSAMPRAIDMWGCWHSHDLNEVRQYFIEHA